MSEEDLAELKETAFKYGDPLRASILTLIAYIEVLEEREERSSD